VTIPKKRSVEEKRNGGSFSVGKNAAYRKTLRGGIAINLRKKK